MEYLDDKAFYEGAWSGIPSAGEFDKADTFTGSGGLLTDSGVVFATSTHTLEPIHLMRLPGEILCSNSLHFLLAEAGDAVDLDYPHYDADIMTIMFGIHRYERSVPTAKGNSVYQYYHCNIAVSRDLQIEKLDKPSPPAFETFEDYRAFLFSEAARVTDNAASAERHVRYQPMATVSSGYDSPAGAVIGKAAGCKEALTFTTARSNFTDREDSGAAIAATLGLSVTEFNYFAPRPARDDFPEVEFIATGHGGDDVVMMVAEPALPGRLLYTGYHGDKIWNKHHKAPSPYIVRGDTSGCSLAEFRLRVGFINLPIPFIGCVRHPEIHRISNAAEMVPWSMNNDYDRPIPRRIVEQAGVARELFGQKKKAITTPYQSNMGVNPPMQEILSEASYRDFLEFVRPIKRYRRLNHKLHYDVMHRLYLLNQRAVWSGKLKRALAIFLLKGPTQVTVPWKYAKPRSNNSLAFHWAAEKMKQRYARSA
ncbi:MAG TPA: hypothetical protein VFM97_03160 [Gammaproteobacteria bacterium]|nr:hypothetical protein [Gammaproteobacteria bacterium]